MFVLAMIATMFVVGSMAVSAGDNEADPTDAIRAASPTGLGSDYLIDLVKETLTVPSNYDIKSFSVDGGVRWRNIKGTSFGIKAGTTDATIIADATKAFRKLLTKDMTLVIANQEIDTDKGPNRGQPKIGATIVEFPKINKRPRVARLNVNYELAYATASTLNPDADKQDNGNAGYWTLTVLSSGRQILATASDIAITTVADKKPNDSNWKTFTEFAEDTEDTKGGGEFDTKGAKYPVKAALDANNRQERDSYFVRTPASSKIAPDGFEYTAASRSRRITVRGVSKPLNPSMKNNEIRLKRNVYFAPAMTSSSGVVSFFPEITLITAARRLGAADARTIRSTATVTDALLVEMYPEAEDKKYVRVEDERNTDTVQFAVWAAPTARKPVTLPAITNRNNQPLAVTGTPTNTK